MKNKNKTLVRPCEMLSFCFWRDFTSSTIWWIGPAAGICWMLIGRAGPTAWNSTDVSSSLRAKKFQDKYKHADNTRCVVVPSVFERTVDEPNALRCIESAAGPAKQKRKSKMDWNVIGAGKQIENLKKKENEKQPRQHSRSDEVWTT